MIVKLRRLYANCVSCFVLKIWLNALCSAFKTAIHCASLRLRNNSTTNEKIRQKRWTKRERKLTLSFFHSFAVFYFPLSQEQDCFKPRCTAVPLSIRMGWMGFQNSKRELKSQTCARSQKGDEQFTSFEHVHTFNKMTGKEKRCGLFSQCMTHFDFTAPHVHKQTWERWVKMWQKNHENITHSCFFTANGLSNVVYYG